MPRELDLQQVGEETERLLGTGPHRLTFPAVLEARFEWDRGAQRARRLWREGLISLIAFSVFYGLEWWITNAVTRQELLVQLGVITPLCLLVNGLMRLNPPRVVREGSVALMSMIIACTYLSFQAQKGPVAAAFTLVGVIVTAMFAAVVMRLRFVFALPACGITLLAGYVFLVRDLSLTMQEKSTGATLTTIAIGIAMMSNYSLEREERLGYLLYLGSEAQRLEIAEKNTQLARISTIDKLTGLPNRRAYEDRFEALWTQALDEGRPLAVVLLDVDHFKILNDVRGHTFGDDVLQRVGSLLPQTLRSERDFAGRYGGEEFVVLLPDTTIEDARQVAERIRALLEMAAAPPQPPVPRSECLMWVTASVGVAAMVPELGWKRGELLEAADRALYQAKAAGRNQVAVGEVMQPTTSHAELRTTANGHVA